MAEGYMPLGVLVAALGSFGPDLPVKFVSEHALSEGEYLFYGANVQDDVDSYRGYYDHLAIEPGGPGVYVRSLRLRLSRAVGETFTGYKGGDFHMDVHTPVWVAPYGNTSDHCIIDVTLRDGVVYLVTTDPGYIF